MTRREREDQIAKAIAKQLHDQFVRTRPEPEDDEITREMRRLLDDTNTQEDDPDGRR